jgi:hypothetical protein
MSSLPNQHIFVESLSVDSLLKAISRDDISELELPTMVDYGFLNHPLVNNQFQDVHFDLLGLYKGCVLLGATRDQFHKACIKNKLDAFIVKTYGDRTSGYYKKYQSGMFNLKNSNYNAL